MTEHIEPVDRQVRHETTDANVRGVVLFAVGLAIVALGIHAIVWVLFTYFSERAATATPAPPAMVAAHESRLPPEPRLQTNPRQDLQDLRAQEDRVLNGYAWVDKPAGVVRIPIDEAKRLILERGLPARKVATK